jgi:CheY-like chemotaxis protein
MAEDCYFSGGNRMKQARIFFVEDDEILARVIEWRLAKLGHTICGSSNNGTEAIEKITQLQPDLVLLDIELQGEMDGINIGEFLASNTKIPFIYLTSHTEDEYLKRAKKTGPKGYIKKPFDDDGLRVAIELAITE